MDDILGQTFNYNNLVLGSGAQKNYANGYYQQGPSLVHSVMDVVRREAERCDSLQGFQIFHSIGGGTGSGLGSLLMRELHGEYGNKVIAPWSVWPSGQTKQSELESYNATLSTHQLLQNSHICFPLDNAAIFNISSRVLKKSAPTFDDLNHVISSSASINTSSLRFKCTLNKDLPSMVNNLAPFPRLHFISQSYVPLTARGELEPGALTVPQLTHDIFDVRNSLVARDPGCSRYLSACCVFRGRQNDLPAKLVQTIFAGVGDKTYQKFSPWVPPNLKTSLVRFAPQGGVISGGFLANTTAISGMFEGVNSQFEAMFKANMHLHKYMEEGMDKDEFTEAASSVQELIAEYHRKASKILKDDKDDA